MFSGFNSESFLKNSFYEAEHDQIEENISRNSAISSSDSCDRHFFSSLSIDQAFSFPGKYTIHEPRF